MSIVKRFITEAIKRTEIDEFLQKKLERAGYGGVNLSKTPLGTHVVVYAMRPGLVIGRGGETIKELARSLEENFKISNPQISFAMLLLNRNQVGYSLARVILVVAAVYDWNTRSVRHFLQVRVLQQPRHDEVNVPRQVLGFVGDVCQREVRGSPIDVQCVSSELRHRHLESHAGSRAGLLENQSRRLVL